MSTVTGRMALDMSNPAKIGSKAILLWWFLLFYVLVLIHFVLHVFVPYVCFHIFS